MGAFNSQSFPKSVKTADLIRFNFFPIDYADPSWLDSEWMPLNSDILKRFAKHGQYHASHLMLDHYQLADQFYFDFKDQVASIALLSSEQLTRLTSLVGVACYSKSIARVILGKERKAIRQLIGDKDYHFAIKKGIYLLDELGLNKTIPKLPSNDQMLDEFFGTGMRCVASLAEKAPAAIVKRLQFKFPRARVTAHWQAYSGEEAAAYSQLTLAILNEVLQ